jgi:hypothetical protein
MITLEALKTIERAALECKERNIDTSEVRAALDFLEPRIFPEWLIPQFRAHLFGDQQYWDKEGQQQVLRVIFRRIREAVRSLLCRHMDELAAIYADSHNPDVKAAMRRLSKEREELREPWKCDVMIH